MPPGGRRPGAGRPKGSKDGSGRSTVLTAPEKELVQAYREQHADRVVRARHVALEFLVATVEDTKAKTVDRINAAKAALDATRAAAPLLVNQVNITAERSELAATVRQRLEDLARISEPAEPEPEPDASWNPLELAPITVVDADPEPEPEIPSVSTDRTEPDPRVVDSQPIPLPAPAQPYGVPPRHPAKPVDLARMPARQHWAR